MGISEEAWQFSQDSEMILAAAQWQKAQVIEHEGHLRQVCEECVKGTDYDSIILGLS